MAKREITIYTDDVTGEETDDIMTVLLVANGVAYEVDMGAQTREQYATAIQPYLSVARRVGRSAGNNVLRPAGGFGSSQAGASSRAGEARPDREQNRAIREWWGRHQGREGLPPLVERGRIPQNVLDAFQRYAGRTIDPEPAPDVSGLAEAVKERAAKPVKSAAPTFTEPDPDGLPKPPKPTRKRTTAAKVTAKAPVKAVTPAAKRTSRRAAAS